MQEAMNPFLIIDTDKSFTAMIQAAAGISSS
jgi:hypothetical protein